MRFEINVERKYVFVILLSVVLFGGLIFVIAQPVPNPGHDVSEVLGAQIDISPNNCGSGQVVKGINDDGSLNCVDQGGGDGGSPAGCVEFGSFTGSGQQAINFPLADCVGKICNILITSNSGPGHFINFRYIQDPPGGVGSGRWMAEGAELINGVSFVRSGLNGNGNQASSLIADGGSIPLSFSLYDDINGVELNSNKWAVSFEGSPLETVSLYLCTF